MNVPAISSPSRRLSISNGLLYAALIILSIGWLTPLVFVVFTALRPRGEVLANGILSWPQDIRWQNFIDAWNVANFDDLYLNSILITAVKVPLGLAISALASYAFTKMRLPFNSIILVCILAGLAVPIASAVFPVFTLVRDMGMLNDLWSLLLPYLAFGLPLQVLILTGYFRLIPDDLVNAARIDGASEIRIFVRIIIPLAAPVIATLCVLDGVATWNELLFALVLLTDQEVRTVPLGLLNFQSQFGTDFTGLTAAIVLAIIPLIILYIALQRYIVNGLTQGALKE